MKQKREAPTEARATHAGSEQNNCNILSFPLHRRRHLLTLQERCRAWHAVRLPRGNYRTPMPEDLAL